MKYTEAELKAMGDEVARIYLETYPVAVVDERAKGGPEVIARFATLKEAETWVGTLPEVEDGRYGIDAPELMVNPPKGRQK